MYPHHNGQGCRVIRVRRGVNTLGEAIGDLWAAGAVYGGVARAVPIGSRARGTPAIFSASIRCEGNIQPHMRAIVGNEAAEVALRDCAGCLRRGRLAVCRGSKAGNRKSREGKHGTFHMRMAFGKRLSIKST